MKYYLGMNQDDKVYQVDNANPDTVYRRWDHSDTEAIYIERDTVVDGVLTCEWTLATWGDRATATYKPINDHSEA